MIKPPNIKDAPFSVLIETCPDLKELRREHAAGTAPERRRAADFTYSQAITSRLFRGFAPDVGGGDGISGTMAALAIDGDFAPALLAVGSIEHQLGRHAEAMKHFLHLPPRQLPQRRLDWPRGTWRIWKGWSENNLATAPDFQQAELMRLLDRLLDLADQTSTWHAWPNVGDLHILETTSLR